MSGAELGARLRERDLTAAPAALNLLENRLRRDEIAALLAEVAPGRLGGEAPAHVVGVTGPPGAGKSTLLSALTRAWRSGGPHRRRARGRPDVQALRRRAARRPRAHRGRSRRTAGCSSARPRPGERLGGLAPATRAAAQALAAAFDVVVIETVGVGQSETEVAEAADTVAVVVQPGSGDVLQFLKAGIMEVPDVLVVTKADLGPGRAARAARPGGGAALARRARRPGRSRSRRSRPSTGIDELVAALDEHRERLDLPAVRTRARRLGALADFVAEHGERGLRALGGRRGPPSAGWQSRNPGSTSPR